MRAEHVFAWARLAKLAIDHGDNEVADRGLAIRAWVHDGCKGNPADVFGFEQATGGVDVDGRAEALVNMIAAHCRNCKSARAKADRLYLIVSRYEQSAAFRDREQFEMANPHPAGSERGDAWTFLQSYRLPSAERIRKIVGHE